MYTHSITIYYVVVSTSRILLGVYTFDVAKLPFIKYDKYIYTKMTLFITNYSQVMMIHYWYYHSNYYIQETAKYYVHAHGVHQYDGPI